MELVLSDRGRGAGPHSCSKSIIDAARMALLSGLRFAQDSAKRPTVAMWGVFALAVPCGGVVVRTDAWWVLVGGSGPPAIAFQTGGRTSLGANRFPTYSSSSTSTCK